MDNDDDVEHLFSWLQTPDLRYREFAGAREITDAVVTWQPREELVRGPVVPVVPVAPVVSAAPAAPFASAAEVRVVAEPPVVVAVQTAPQRAVPVPPVVREPTIVVPSAAPVAEPPRTTHGFSGPFGLGAAGRAPAYRTLIEEPVVAPVAPPPAAPPRQPPAVPPPPPAAAPAAAAEGAPGGERSLDAVFGRLSAARSRLPDPRDRLRHIPGLNPPPGRPR